MQSGGRIEVGGWLGVFLAISLTPVASATPSTQCSAGIAQASARLSPIYSGFHAAAIGAKGGGHLFDRVFGKGVDLHSRFLLGSITKSLNAAVMLRLVDRGILNIEEPLLPHVPAGYRSGLSTNWSKITLRRLMNHTTGIHDYLSPGNDKGPAETDPDDNDSPETTVLGVPRTLLEILNLTVAKPLLFTPGSQLRYSNTNYLLATQVAADVDGRSNAEMFKQELVQTLALPDTGTIQAPDSSLLGSTTVYPGNMHGVGNAYSSASDLMSYLTALDDTTLLPAGWVTRMETPEPDCGPGPKCDRYGFGFSIRLAAMEGHKWILHEGHLSGVSAVIAKVPDLDLNFALVSDKPSVDNETLAKQILDDLILAGCAE